MKIFNYLDEQQRFYNFKATTENGKQENSHGVSYLYSRNFYKELGDVMGLDKIVLEGEGR